VPNQYPQSKTAPWQHQIDGFNKAKNHDGYYYAWDMGAGKSKGGVDFCNAIDAKKVLIVSPNKVMPVWPGQFRIHSDKEFSILTVIKKLGNADKKARAVYENLKKCEQFGQPSVFIINYESVWREQIGPVTNDKGRITGLGVLLSQQWDLIISDEAHRMKSPGGKASWMMKRLYPKSNRRLWLSGTPMAHSPLDLYAQFRALDPSVFGTNFTFFKKRYCEMGGFEGREILGWINQDELKQKFFSIADHVSADDCLDLPDKHDIMIRCDLDPKTKRIYNELSKDFIAGVDGGVITVSNALVKLLRLAQIAGGYLVYEHEVDEFTSIKKDRIIDNNKLDTTIEILKDLPPQEPVVLWFRFRNEIDRMRAAIEKHFTGKDKRSITEVSGRHDLQRDFADGIWLGKTTDTALIQIQSGCEGIDLTNAHYNFYFSMGLSLGQYRQSRKRTRRPGQTKKVFYYHMVSRGTVDIRIMRAMESKTQVVNSILKETKQELGKPMSIIQAPDFLSTETNDI
jgi:SNF2 family DNA or RNA helicase